MGDENCMNNCHPKTDCFLDETYCCMGSHKQCKHVLTRGHMNCPCDDDFWTCVDQAWDRYGKHNEIGCEYNWDDYRQCVCVWVLAMCQPHTATWSFEAENWLFPTRA